MSTLEIPRTRGEELAYPGFVIGSISLTEEQIRLSHHAKTQELHKLLTESPDSNEEPVRSEAPNGHGSAPTESGSGERGHPWAPDDPDNPDTRWQYPGRSPLATQHVEKSFASVSDGLATDGEQSIPLDGQDRDAVLGILAITAEGGDKKIPYDQQRRQILAARRIIDGILYQ